MKVFNLNEVETEEQPQALAKVGVWSKVSGFLFQEIDLSKPIVLELTPKQEKVLTEVHDFLFQEIKFPELHDFFFKDITLFGKKKDQA